MSHAAARWGGSAGDEGHDRLLDVLLNMQPGVGFVAAPDLTDHDDGIGFRVGIQQVEHFDEVEAFDGITPDADAGGLTDSACAALPDGFVGECAAAADDADLLPALGFFRGRVDVAGHDPDFAFTGGDDARAIRPDQDAVWFFLQKCFDLDHVENGNAFGDGDDDGNPRVGGFHDRVGGERWGYENHRRICPGSGNGLADRIENRQSIRIFLAPFAGGNATDYFRAILEAIFRVKRTGFTGDALTEDSRGLIDQNAHRIFVLLDGLESSIRESAETIRGRRSWQAEEVETSGIEF